ncbi:MAG: hypothetical protein ABSB32_16695 [Thermodesulfobacteriota bacterium]
MPSRPGHDIGLADVDQPIRAATDIARAEAEIAARIAGRRTRHEERPEKIGA